MGQDCGVRSGGRRAAPGDEPLRRRGTGHGVPPGSTGQPAEGGEGDSPQQLRRARGQGQAALPRPLHLSPPRGEGKAAGTRGSQPRGHTASRTRALPISDIQFHFISPNPAPVGLSREGKGRSYFWHVARSCLLEEPQESWIFLSLADMDPRGGGGRVRILPTCPLSPAWPKPPQDFCGAKHWLDSSNCINVLLVF